MFHILRIIYKINWILQTLDNRAGNVRMQLHTKSFSTKVTKQRGEQTRCRPTPVAFFGEGPLIPPADSVWAEGPPAAAAN